MEFISSYQTNFQNLINLPKPPSPIVRLNTICPYFTMFPLDFPFSQLIHAKAGDWVLDPFCGRGTTSFAARLLSLPSYGIDTSPIAYAISSAKFVNSRPTDIINLCKKILDKDARPKKIPKGRFWDLCYHSSTLRQICLLREALLQDCSSDEAIALRALILGILHGPIMKTTTSYLSNQMPRTYSTKPDYSVHYWEKRGLLPNKIDMLEIVTKRANYTFKKIPKLTDGGTSLSDARKKLEFSPQNGFNWIITSPPYFGMETYVQDQWLRKWFLGGPEYVDYSKTDQLKHSNEQIFIQELAAVWKNITHFCAPNAKMVIRFGTIPSYSCNPLEIIQESLNQANSGWKQCKVETAGVPSNGRRQSDQFGGKMGPSREEIDYYAILT